MIKPYLSVILSFENDPVLDVQKKKDHKKVKKIRIFTNYLIYVIIEKVIAWQIKMSPRQPYSVIRFI